jgi:hypothetical protein
VEKRVWTCAVVIGRGVIIVIGRKHVWDISVVEILNVNVGEIGGECIIKSG